MLVGWCDSKKQLLVRSEPNEKDLSRYILYCSSVNQHSLASNCVNFPLTVKYYS